MKEVCRVISANIDGEIKPDYCVGSMIRLIRDTNCRNDSDSFLYVCNVSFPVQIINAIVISVNS